MVVYSESCFINIFVWDRVFSSKIVKLKGLYIFNFKNIQIFFIKGYSFLKYYFFAIFVSNRCYCCV